VYDLSDPNNSVVLTSGGAATPATYRGDVVDNNGTVIVDVSSTSTTFTGGLLGNTYGDVYNPTGANKILESGTGNLDSVLTVDTANATTLNATTTNISGIATFTGSSVDFTGTTTMGSWNGPVYDRTGGTLIIEDNASPNPIVHADLDGDVTGTVSSIANHDTGDLTEGSNLYYTDARVGTYIGGDRTYGNITTTGYVAGPAVFTIDPAGVGDNTGKVVIAGDLQVDGTTTTINSTTLTVDDKNIVLASGSADAATANGAGITVDGANATITYDGTNDEWDFNKDINVAGDITLGDVNPQITFNDSSTSNLQHLIVSSSDKLLLSADHNNVDSGTKIEFAIDGTERMEITATGIDVTGTITGDDGLSIQGGSGNAYLQVGSDTGSWTWKNYRSTHKLALEDSDGTGEVLNFDTSGHATFANNVSIQGTTFIDGGNGYFRDTVGNSFSSGWNANTDDHSTWINFEGYQGGTTKFRDLRIGDGKQQAITMFDGSTGNVGIGTAAPAHKLEVAGTTKAEQYLLDAIAKDISSVTSDVFVYDTRKDSDGGAWRKRTQHTSWYNETLNTATRGARKEFPAVAVIVAEGQKVTIYDGDDPDVPMWMEFNVSGGTEWQLPSLLCANTVGCNGIAALNGIITSSSSPYGYRYLNFISERSEFRELGYYRLIKRPIIDRNATNNINPIELGISGHLPADACNDVAMTVLPNAPIDSATGLPIPTIAVATASGVGVIKYDGTVVKVMTNNSYGVAFTKNYELVHTVNDASSTFSNHIREIPSADTTTTATRRYYRAGNNTGTIPSISSTSSEPTANILATLPNNTLAVASNGTQAALNILQEVPNAPTTGMIAYVASDYNTGWMNGDIKLATLSDTDDTNVTGSELVTNGTFDSNTTGWTANGGSSLSHQSGQAKVTASNSNIMLTQQLSGLVVGQKYTLSATITPFIGASGAFWGLYLNNVFSNLVAQFSASDQTPTKVSTTFTATATNNYISIAGSSGAIVSGEYLLVDNVSVRIAEEDRSVNDNGLQVFGTVTKSAVATGADLVGYSGWSTSNYLFQPYNSSLSPGNSDIYFSHWYKGSTNKVMIWTSLRRPVAQGDAGGWIQFWTGTASGTQLQFGVNNGIGRDNRVGINSTSFHDGQWHHYVGLRRNGIYEIYVDGQLQGSTNHASNSTLTTDTHKFLVGNHFDFNGAYSVSGDMALVKYSLTAPSPEQIAKIYNDEKFLFQENAKATLYGTSDAVTALAYDDDTELLHAGTSAGRSVFQGLRRIDNTTNAVGDAISASNGMVAEG